MQVYASILVTALRAILEISFDRTANGRQLSPDLVVPASLEIDLQQMISVQRSDRLIIQFRSFAVWNLFIMGIGFVLLLVAGQVVDQGSE